MLVAIALDKPLADVKELVESPTRLIAEIKKILQDKQAHPVLPNFASLLSQRQQPPPKKNPT